MKKPLFIIYLVMIYQMTIQAQAVYVDSNTGDDKNSGTKESPVYSVGKAAEIIRRKDNDIYTMKINPGIYVLDSHVLVSTEKDMTEKRILIEAGILPGDPSWTPEKMPVITSKTMKGEIPVSETFVVGFLIDESHVTVRGLKFHGYFYPNTRYFPIARLNKTKTDLSVEQCMFIGDENISQIQAGVLAHGNEIKIDHCIFYKLRNTVVFWEDAGNGIKNGNALTNSIIFGASQAVWTVAPDIDFKFKNNIVSNCKYVWVRNNFNTTKNYSIENCIIVNNQHYKGIAESPVLVIPAEFEIKETNVIKEGEISLRLIENVDAPLPIDYMHIIPDTPGYETGAGIF